MNDHPVGHKNVVSQDRWALTGSIILKSGTFCQKYLVFQHVQYLVSPQSGLSRQILLYKALSQSDGNMYGTHKLLIVNSSLIGTYGSIKSGPIQVLFFLTENYESQIIILKTPTWMITYLTAMASRRSLFNRRSSRPLVRSADCDS